MIALQSGISALLLSAVLSARAQPNPLMVPEHPFVNYAANRIVMNGDPDSWLSYHRKLDQLVFEGKGQINVVHFGGSHVQADMWTMELRQRMQTLVPGIRAGRGLIFPYSMARTNNPYWYEPTFTGNWSAVRNVTQADSSVLGVAGISVTTKDPVSELKVRFRGEAYSGYSFDRVRVLHHMDSSFEVHAWDSDSTLRISRQVNEREGYTEFVYDRLVDTLRVRFLRTDTVLQKQFTLRGIVLDGPDPGMIVHSCGVNGASTKSWLRCQDMPRELALLKPDLVILSIGINDAHDPDFSPSLYEANYRELIRRIRSVAPDAAILLTTNTDSFMKRKYPNRNAVSVRDAMLRLSANENVAVWDTYGVMGGEGSIKLWEKAGLAQADRVHFKREGYALLGDLLFTALTEAYGTYLRTSER